MKEFKKLDEFMLQQEARWSTIMNKLGIGPQKNSIAKALGNGEYMLGNNRIMSLAGVTEQVFLNYDWNNGKLSFLKDGTWVARLLHLQISSGVEQVIAFNGEWMAGNFLGQKFIGKFHGTEFQGGFISNYTAYQADPSTFINGAVASYKEGVLGLAKLDVTSINASSAKKIVSLLELQVGYYCNLTDDNGTTHAFRVMKSCDNTSMDIELQEETGQKRAIRIPWREIRKGNDPALFRRLSSIRIGGKPQIPYLFANDRVGAITNIEISTKPTMFGTTVDTYKVATMLLRPLVLTGPDLTIHLFSPEEVTKYGQMYQDLKNNGMQMHMRNIIDGIKYGIITGWEGYPHLAPVFGNVKGEAVKHPKYAASMQWLDEFVQLIVLRTMKSRTVGRTYMPSEIRRKKMIDGLSQMIVPILPKPAAPAPAATPSNSGGSTAVPPKRRSVIP